MLDVSEFNFSSIIFVILISLFTSNGIPIEGIPNSLISLILTSPESKMVIFLSFATFIIAFNVDGFIGISVSISNEEFVDFRIITFSFSPSPRYFFCPLSR